VKANYIIIKAKICENKPYNNKCKICEKDDIIIKGKICENKLYNNKK
jgi:hypothetical protein